jgi:hypothetical protein
MSKILFLPFKKLGDLVATAIAKKVFAGVWMLVEHEEPPRLNNPQVSWQKFIPALLLEGAVFRAARGIVDRASREAFDRLTDTPPDGEAAESIH